ncbi:hypothetical protein LR48_Vigan04g002800 [Vigna angularis]|nr:disease resistance-like protein DSC1 isoform X1 [Vigna angularis]XP_052732565.1 disease resistance-like protein DSC1 isoform X1 [Vigna angularis]XP_052732566.1 disease resistance-like protein DSC1 isoform X1 [Vigna angularis]KOM39830.1 hypothetical protein LR48_Vigan04g002800 [Vigna angularis]BAT80150.1 hypothetical protein VIGAN_02312900 [Vigna angularis var. angularis]
MLNFCGSYSFIRVLFSFVSWLFGGLKGAEEKPTTDNNDPTIDNNDPKIKHDVFVSFRGKDVHRGFLSHLTEAFQRRNIDAFVADNNLEKGEEIWPSLVEAIEGSSISLVIFSQNYVSSRWCLEELVTILECREKYGTSVLPVFYYVEPTYVRHQSEVQRWRRALKLASRLAGINSSKFSGDAELVKEIVNEVLKRLVKQSINTKGLVGIDEKIAAIESLMTEEPKQTRLIGIWGMGGIGKTTLAEEVFNKLQSEYEGSYFAASETDRSNKHELISLKEKMFSKLLGYDVKIDTPNSLPKGIVRRIGCMKVLIVLDGVNESEQLEKLLGTLDNFGSGSRIIVTTRDEQVLRANKADKIYQLKEFNFDKALELFHLNAFKTNDHVQEYKELSKRVVDYAQGIPLVVKVLAGLLHGKNKEEWESMLGKLKKMPPKEVYEVMKLSYDSLDRKGKQIFLDLACFFLRTHVAVNVDYLKSLLKDDDSDNSVAFELGRLKDKALITISDDNTVSIHDSLQEIAWEIVRQESVEHPGNRSRLWELNDICEALKNDKVKEAIRSIRVHLPTIKEQKLVPQILEINMSKLKFLEVFVCDRYDELTLLKGPQFLATELRFLSWYQYPLKSLPENFSAEKLVILKLRNGRMEKLWDGVKNMVNLKQVDLSRSQNLKKLPDLSKATNLEVLLLMSCSSLTSVHPSIFSLPKLVKLDLLCCTSLTTLGSSSSSCNLSFLNLGRCTNLRKFLLISENIKKLRLGNTMVKELPSSISNFNQLLHLDISFCSKLRTIPKLPLSLETLNARECQSLKTILFPSPAVEQLKENRKGILFWKCTNLDNQTLVAIGLNVQMNVMNYANQHISTPCHNHVEHCDDDNCDSYSGVYVYPGSRVPKWLEYKTRKDSIIIDLSSAPPSLLIGFIFCFVLGKYHNTDVDRFEVMITIDGEDEGKNISVPIYIDYGYEKTESDHVCVMYEQRCSTFLNNRAKNQTRFKIQVTVEEALSHKFLKGFGVSLINRSTYKNFIQEMQLRESQYQFR